MLLKGSTRFNKANTFNIHQVSIKKNLTLGFASFQMILIRESCLTGDVGEEEGGEGGM